MIVRSRLLLVLATVLAGCAGSVPSQSVPPRERVVVVDRIAGSTPGPVVVYSFSTGCEVGLGALSRVTDPDRAALCEGFTRALGPGVRALPHERGRFEEGHPGDPAQEQGAAWRLVIRLVPEQYPGGLRDQGLGRGARLRYTGELRVLARLVRVADGETVREIRYNGRVMGFTYERERFEAVGRAIGARVVRDFAL